MVREASATPEKIGVKSKNADKLKIVLAVGAFALAGVGFVRFYKSSNPPEGKAWFYDLSARRLFVAPHSSIPPIHGVEGEEEDGVRAIVVSMSGNCTDENSRRIAYLETYTPELKRQLELRKKNDPALIDNAPSTIRRGEAHSFILVKRPEEADWHPMTAPEAQEILQTISRPGPDGRTPVVCAPN